MAHAFDAYPLPAGSSTVSSPAKLRDEIHRLTNRLLRARESYNQDLLSGDPEVPLDEQRAVIDSYQARLDSATEQLRQHEGGALPAPEVPVQRLPVRVQPPVDPEVQGTHVPQAQVPGPPAPTPQAPAQTGPGISNPDGTALLGDGGTVLRSEDVAVGEYVRHAADQRWQTATGRAVGDELDVVCQRILAALAHKHGVPLEDERRQLVRQVDARYRRDYG